MAATQDPPACPEKDEVAKRLAVADLGISRWSIAVIVLATVVVVWTGIARFMDPVGEKYVPAMPPGNADFFFPFGGARALLQGENPYLNDIPGLADPWRRGFGLANGRQYRGLYPPTHFLLYLPLALITPNFREAGRILFFVNLLALLSMAVVAWRLVADTTNVRAVERRLSMLLVPILFVLLTCNVGTSLGLERGNGGDILSAALCWAAVILLLRRRHFWAVLLLVPGVLTKGYPALFGLGFVFLDFNRRTWKPIIVGTLTGLAIFLVPVARYLREFVTLFVYSTPITGNTWWWNHSFENVWLHASPGLVRPGKWAMATCCIVLSSACWLRARRALASDSLREAGLWTALFATFSIETVLGSSHSSLIYNLVLVMPGLLVAYVVHPVFVQNCRLSASWNAVLGLSNLASAFLVFKAGLFGSRDFPAAGIGMTLFIVTMAGAMLAARLQKTIA